MSITATVRHYLSFSGDQLSELLYNSGELADSPATSELVNLTAGDNTVTVPEITDFTVHGVVIVPPDANEIEPTLKGIAADTGILLSATFVSLIQFGATVPASIVLNVTDDVTGFRLVWF